MSKQIKMVDISMGNRHIRIKAFTDSGNLLRDAVSGRQVIVMDKNTVSALFDTDVCAVIRGLSSENIVDCYEQLAVVSPTAFGLISYNTADKKSALMLTVKVNNITVDGEQTSKYMIGISTSEIDIAGGCTAVIGV